MISRYRENKSKSKADGEEIALGEKIRSESGTSTGDGTEEAGEETPPEARTDRGVAEPETSANDEAVVDESDTDESQLESAVEEEELLPALEGERLRSCIEAILFAATEPVPRRRLRRMLKDVDRKVIDEALLALEADCLTHARGFGLIEDAAGLQLLSKPEFAPYVARLRGEKRIRLSQAAFESLAVIAYRQPIRRTDLEAIRGVQSAAVVKNLMEWGLVQIVGRDEETLGRPLLYGTTRMFLEQFGLPGLDGLPEPERLLELGGEHGMEVVEEIEASAGRLEAVESSELFDRSEEEGSEEETSPGDENRAVAEESETAEEVDGAPEIDEDGEADEAGAPLGCDSEPEECPDAVDSEAEGTEDTEEEDEERPSGQ